LLPPHVILSQKFIKFSFGLTRPQTLLGSLLRPPDPLAGIKGPTSTNRKGEGRGREGEGPPFFITE